MKPPKRTFYTCWIKHSLSASMVRNRLMDVLMKILLPACFIALKLTGSFIDFMLGLANSSVQEDIDIVTSQVRDSRTVYYDSKLELLITLSYLGFGTIHISSIPQTSSWWSTCPQWKFSGCGFTGFKRNLYIEEFTRKEDCRKFQFSNMCETKIIRKSTWWYRNYLWKSHCTGFASKEPRSISIFFIG